MILHYRRKRKKLKLKAHKDLIPCEYHEGDSETGEINAKKNYFSQIGIWA